MASNHRLFLNLVTGLLLSGSLMGAATSALAQGPRSSGATTTGKAEFEEYCA